MKSRPYSITLVRMSASGTITSDQPHAAFTAFLNA